MLSIWCLDWPIVAARAQEPSLEGVPVAILARSRVLAASTEARNVGVISGLRRREAEARCPGIEIREADPSSEARAFEVVARCIETLTPRIEIERPGILSFPTLGPSRYFGGDESLVAAVLAALKTAGVEEARVGIADGVFAARLAARSSIVVPRNATPEFLAPWSVVHLGEPDLSGVLMRLGIRTLGDFGALPVGSVVARFGAQGLEAHRLSIGEERYPPALSTPPPDLVESCVIDPPSNRVDEAAFIGKTLADRLLERLAALGLACTRVVIACETEHGESLERCWRHEGALTPATLATRVRWQLDGWLTESGGLSGGLTLLRLIPDEVIPAGGSQLGFWGGDQAGADRAARVFARVQGMLGPDSVVTAVEQGGRTPIERVRWVTWGEPRLVDFRGEGGKHRGTGMRGAGASGGHINAESWPGAVPGPAPARVFDPPYAAQLLDSESRPVLVNARGDASSTPSILKSAALPGQGGEVSAWAGPWAQDVRWWDPLGERRVLWHVVVGDVACLVRVEHGRATLDAIYD